MKTRGNTLATTLLVGTLILLLGLTAASTGIFHLNFGLRAGHGDQATNAADAAIAQAVERLLTEPGFGKTDDPSQSVEVKLTDSVGRVAFSQQQAADWGIPESHDNRGAAAAVEGWNGRSLPVDAIQVVAVGESGGVKRTVEAIYHVPGFPYALASSGPVHSSGRLVVGALDSVEEAVDGFELEDLSRADLRSNAAGLAVELDGTDTRVSGNLEAKGSIMVSDGVTVDGELRPFAGQVDLPPLEVERYFEKGGRPLLGGETLVAGVRESSEHVTRLSQLRLDEGVLLVNGDLIVDGPVVGRGAIVARGKVTLNSGVALAAANEVALIAQDTVTISGSPDGSYFQGIIYTEGDLVASDITLVGAFLANHPEEAINPGSHVTLDNVGLVSVPEAADFIVNRSHVSFSFRNNVRDNDLFPVGDQVVNFTVDFTPEQISQLHTLIFRLQSNDRDNTPRHQIKRLLLDANISGPPGMEFDEQNMDGPEEGVNPLDMVVNALVGQGFSPTGGTQTQVTAETSIFHFGLNEYLSQADRIRLRLWKAH
ncbi:MAG: hypothetical protein AB7S38_42420 [Vulcanimicrobiota bacterium]